jgi:hypothetical protein
LIGEWKLKQIDESRDVFDKEFKKERLCQVQNASHRGIYSKHELDLPLNALYHLLVPCLADRED